MAHLCRRPGLAQKSEPRRLIAQIAFVTDLQCHRTTKIDIERLVGHTHSPTPQLDRSASLVQHHFKVLESAKLLRTVNFLGNWLPLTQILNPIPRWLQIPGRKLCSGYKLDRTRYQGWRRTSCRRLGRRVLPVALALGSVPAFPIGSPDSVF